jgi:hypothetical protein
MNDWGAQIVDFGLEKPRFQLTDKQRVCLGPLAEAFRHDDPIELLNELYECFRHELQEAWGNPVMMLRPLTALLEAYLVLSSAGVREVDEGVVDLHLGLERIERAGRKVLIRALLSRKISDEDAETIMSFLIDQIEKKQWLNWTKEFSAEACRKP